MSDILHRFSKNLFDVSMCSGKRKKENCELSFVSPYTSFSMKKKSLMELKVGTWNGTQLECSRSEWEHPEEIKQVDG